MIQLILNSHLDFWRSNVLIKPGARQPQAGAPGFLELLLSANFCMRVCVCVCVYVSAPEAINNYSREVELYRAITQTLEL